MKELKGIDENTVIDCENQDEHSTVLKIMGIPFFPYNGGYTCIHATTGQTMSFAYWEAGGNTIIQAADFIAMNTEQPVSKYQKGDFVNHNEYGIGVICKPDGRGGYFVEWNDQWANHSEEKFLTLCLPEKWAIKTDRQEFYDWFKGISNTLYSPDTSTHWVFPRAKIESTTTEFDCTRIVLPGYELITFEYWCRVHRPDLLEDAAKVDELTSKIADELNASELPEKWCVRRTPENAEVLNAWGSQKGGSLLTCIDYWVCFNGSSNIVISKPPYPEITYEQWQTVPEVAEWLIEKAFSDNLMDHLGINLVEKVEEREIIGRVVPMDLYGGAVKDGDVVMKSKHWNAYETAGQGINPKYYFPCEIVASWPPYYGPEKPKRRYMKQVWRVEKLMGVGADQFDSEKSANDWVLEKAQLGEYYSVRPFLTLAFE